MQYGGDLSYHRAAMQTASPPAKPVAPLPEPVGHAPGAPGTCKVVEGPVSPKGWCVAYVKKP